MQHHSVGSETALKATVHGFAVGYWWVAGIYFAAAILCGALIRPVTGMNREMEAASLDALVWVVGLQADPHVTNRAVLDVRPTPELGRLNLMITSPRPPDRVRAPGSQVLHAIDQLTSKPGVAWVLLSGDLVWLGFSVVVGFPARLEAIFQTLIAALTFALVFVIQHTQTREQLVTQRKLDEILRALPGADNAVIGLEDATDIELSAVHDDHRQLREEATTGMS